MKTRDIIYGIGVLKELKIMYTNISQLTLPLPLDFLYFENRFTAIVRSRAAFFASKLCRFSISVNLASSQTARSRFSATSRNTWGKLINNVNKINTKNDYAIIILPLKQQYCFIV